MALRMVGEGLGKLDWFLRAQLLAIHAHVRAGYVRPCVACLERVMVGPEESIKVVAVNVGLKFGFNDVGGEGSRRAGRHSTSSTQASRCTALPCASARAGSSGTRAGGPFSRS